MSYFRAGFISYGGVLGHYIFSNTINMGLSSLKYVCEEPANISFDALVVYADANISSAIKEWNICPLEKMTINGFQSLDAYNLSSERRSTTPFTMFYLDNLYFM